MKYNNNCYPSSESNDKAANPHIQSSSLRTTYHRSTQPSNKSIKGNDNTYTTCYQTQTDYSKYNYGQYIPTKVSKYNFPSSYRVLDTTLQENTLKDLPKKVYPINHQHDNWASMINRTSAEDSICNKQSRISKSKNFQSNVFTEQGMQPPLAKRCAKETNYSKYSTTSQIYALSGCVKRNPKEINDDGKRSNITNIGRMMKLSKEFNADFIQSSTLEPIIMSFPCEQRYGSSFKVRPKSQITFSKEECKAEEIQSHNSMKKRKGSYRHLQSSIFNNEAIINNNHSIPVTKEKSGNYFDTKGKRHYHTKETFRSHIVIE